jgi:REP element-mobilizing transposase RayT
MARTIRLEFPGACYHVLNRGSDGSAIFKPTGAAALFEQILLEASEACAWRLHAYAILENRFHLAVETPEPNLTAGMKRLQGTWANRFSRDHPHFGRPFRGRFTAIHIEPGPPLARLAQLIHLAGAASSASHGEPPATGPSLESLSRGWAIGSKEFRASLLDILQTRRSDLGRAGFHPGKTHRISRQAAEAAWEELITGLARRAGIDLENLPAKKSAGEKALLAAALRRIAPVANDWLAHRLQMGSPAGVSHVVRQFATSYPQFKDKLNQLLAQPLKAIAPAESEFPAHFIASDELDLAIHD